MQKEKQTHECIISDVSDGHLQKKKKKKRRGDDGSKAVDQSTDPENYSKKTRKRKQTHSNLEEIFVSPKSGPDQIQSNISEENGDVQIDDEECSVKKRKNRKRHLTDNVSTESERNEEITDKSIVIRTERESVNPVKRKKNKKKDKTQRLSQCEETTVNDDKESCQDANSPKNSDELEEIRRQERKQKKKNKKLKKLKQKDVKSTSEFSEVGPNACQLALDYLSHWEKDREHWRFQKVRQVWLLQNMYDANKVNNSSFKTLLLYLDGLKGRSRETTVKKAEDIIAHDEDSDADTKDVSKVKLERARQLIQVLT
ncbi:uncharacterized protein C7orf50 homolog [Liolophura sinensis]|uniref:uncharacterized protein C7orf50 homolog n=1 Tax=Liolophura sinensis TaxID=3198878 RepID=UPI003157F534